MSDSTGCVNNKKVKIYWVHCFNNYANFHTKHYAPEHHRNARKNYILKGFQSVHCDLQDCVLYCTYVCCFQKYESERTDRQTDLDANRHWMTTSDFKQ